MLLTSTATAPPAVTFSKKDTTLDQTQVFTAPIKMLDTPNVESSMQSGGAPSLLKDKLMELCRTLTGGGRDDDDLVPVNHLKEAIEQAQLPKELAERLMAAFSAAADRRGTGSALVPSR